MSISTYTHVFSYGSNSLWQLRRRVGNPTLTASPASLPGYTRVFCISSAAWKSGGVASLAPSHIPSNPPVRGSVVKLTDAELARLDSYEGGYRRELLHADVGGIKTPVPVVAYIAGDGAGGRWTLPMVQPPSEMYLNACRLHLREHWPLDECDVITISTYGEDGLVKELRKWEYPGIERLGLEAMLIDANRLSKDPWVDGGPEKKLNTVNTAKGFREVGIHNVPDLASLLRDCEGTALNEKLRKAGLAPVNDAMVEAMRKLLHPPL